MRVVKWTDYKYIIKSFSCNVNILWSTVISADFIHVFSCLCKTLVINSRNPETSRPVHVTIHLCGQSQKTAKILLSEYSFYVIEGWCKMFFWLVFHWCNWFVHERKLQLTFWKISVVENINILRTVIPSRHFFLCVRPSYYTFWITFFLNIAFII
jgi:hypothetical protein